MNVKLLYYATGNKGKFDDVKQFFAQYPDIEVRQFDKDLPEEQTDDQQAIAIEKARLAWQELKHPVLVDDGGIYFDRYHNFPGTLTKFVYKGLGRDGIYRLFDEGDKARFKLTLVYYYGDNTFSVFTQESAGHLVKPITGFLNDKLPFECILVPDGYDKTYYELRNTETFSKINYRIKALQAFMEYITRSN